MVAEWGFNITETKFLNRTKQDVVGTDDGGW